MTGTSRNEASVGNNSADQGSPRTVAPQHATSTHLTVQNSDFVLIFGLARPVWDPTKGLAPGLNLEPVSAVSINPMTAKQLLRQLTQAIASFERMTNAEIPDWGEISESTDEASLQSS